MSSTSSRSHGRVALILALIAAAMGLGLWVGVQIAHDRHDDRNRAVAERVRERGQADARRERAADAAEARKERRQKLAESRLDAMDDAIERANRDLLQAAKAGRRRDVARAEAALAQATRRRDAADKSPAHLPRDPFERELDGFPIKESPLFVQQVTSSDGDHKLFVSVSRPLLCLQSPADRPRRVHETYDPVERRLRGAGIEDFEMIVTPLTLQAPTLSDALVVASGDTVVLTSRGRAC